jgi:dihydroorotate dehydrogenase
MYGLLRSLLFRTDPEKAHYWAMARLAQLCRLPGVRNALKKRFLKTGPTLQRTVWGLSFPNPVGLAAGFDKDARWTDDLAALGFGFIEIGTVTPRPQPGNDKPRLFRLKEDEAVINRMGFNNGGASAAAGRLKFRKDPIIIGGNIGKNKDTPNEAAIADYEQAFRDLYAQVDYFVVNVSSPNTPNLRALQDKEPLEQLLRHLKALNEQLGAPKPLLLKIAPDLTDGQLDDIVTIARELPLDGLVATNTTIDRTGLQSPGADAVGAGGLSGKPLRVRSTEVVRYLSGKLGSGFPIIAAGGIFTAADAQEKLDAGAVLVQVYTGFIYEGPTIATDICTGLSGMAAS